MNEIGFVDTTLRDGQQSLWAERMTTGMMLSVAERMDNAGFEAIELISSSHFKKCVRELREDPWERIRLVSQRITKTPLRLIAGRFNNFEITPQSVYRLFIERLAANGLRQIRISDEWNDLSGWQRKVQTSREFGLDPLVNLIFSVSPKHTDEYYAQKAREAATLGVDRLCLKDPGGLLTPERTRKLVPLILQNSNGKHLELHTHCTTGLGPLCCLEAIKLGVKTVNTALPPLYKESVYRLFIERLAANGLRQIRISDEWNDLSGWQRKVQTSREFGLDPLVNLIFSVSPKHTDEYYAQKAREAATLGVDRLCLKDPGGLLTPERTRKLVPLILQNSNGKHLELHTHCTTGLGPLCCLEAIKLGVKTVNTALPPLANASSNPSFFNVASNARALGYTPAVDEESVKPVSEHFMFIAKREGFPIGAPVEYDYSQYPGKQWISPVSRFNRRVDPTRGTVHTS